MLRRILMVVFFAWSGTAWAADLPQGFVRLSSVDPSIRQDIRYAGHHNFLGRPVAGYGTAAECILTEAAALALKAVSADLKQRGLGLLVWDCYRPEKSVADFMAWAQTPDTRTKAEFYPSVRKTDFERLGYVARHSSHSRGSAVDLTIVKIKAPPPQNWQPGDRLVACTAPYGTRYIDGGLDMGTGFDCFDEMSHPGSGAVSAEAHGNRSLLARTMAAHGFRGIDSEWWHFALAAEPFPDRSFNFDLGTP
ncbi:MAG: M15 family metallopeptidase [Rhodospirillaceae bacterium]|nr:M15 family metallopeptidase [Rhodospirillaceae bacterium]